MAEKDPYRDVVEIPGFRSRFGGLWTDLSNARDLVAGRLAIGELGERAALNLSAFIENGYVILRGTASDEVIDMLNADMARIVAGPPPEAWVTCFEDGHWVQRPLRSEDANAHDKRVKVARSILFLPSAREAIFCSRYAQVLEARLHAPGIGTPESFFFKGSQQPLHKDTAFVRVSSAMEFVASWTALEDVKPGSGELIY